MGDLTDGGRSHWWVILLVGDLIGGRPPWWKIPLVEDLLGEKTPFLETFFLITKSNFFEKPV